MPSGAWNDFTDLPAEFISQFGTFSNNEPKQNSCLYSTAFIYFATAMDEILTVACFIATVVNFVVVACSAKLYNEKGDTLHLFILNMTIGDSILTLFCHPYELVMRRYGFALLRSVTIFSNFANWVGLAVSGLSLTLLNVDKLIFFCWPFKYDIWMSYFRAKLFFYLTWIISIGFATYYWLYSYMYTINTTFEPKQRFEIQFAFLTVFTNGAEMSPLNKFFYEAFTVAFCVVPIVSSLLVSCYLYDLTKRKRKLIIRTTVRSKTNYNATSFAFIFATTLWTSCSLLPYRLANLARIYVIAWQNLECDSRQSLSWVTWSMLYLLILNPIINPLITAFAYAPYRQMIFSVVRKASKDHLQQYSNGIFNRNKKKQHSKPANNSTGKIFHIELTIRKHNQREAVLSPKAPLAKLPSICSCGSLSPTDNLHCTRF